MDLPSVAAWSPESWTNVDIPFPGGFFSPHLGQSNLGRPRGLESVVTAYVPAFPGPYFKVIRGSLDEASGRVSYDILAASDAGNFAAGATSLEPNGLTRMCARFWPKDGGSRDWQAGEPDPELVIVEYGPDAGSVLNHTGIRTQACREFIALDGGFLAYTLENPTNVNADAAEFANPALRTRILELSSSYEFVDGGHSKLDAGYCVISEQEPLSGWCDSTTHDEVLRYDSWRGSPSSAFRYDAGVTVIAQIAGHLVVGINEHHTGDGYARYDIGWLRNGAFELIRESQVVPVGYGSWTADTAAFTFIRPDLEKWDVDEVPYVCP